MSEDKQNLLDAGSFPLWGSRLIEASAGTGKTWTIAALYLRLVLGHGGEQGTEQGFGRPLLPAEILVMTFTRAATRELSDRIRARLLEAAKCFRGEAEVAAHDGLLQGLLTDYADAGQRSAAARRLSLAAESMDDAAVHTIDAWCQRMLREHAFDSGCLFDEELIGDEQAMLLEASQDYWRAQLYPLGGAALDQALAVFGNVEALQADARALVGQGLPAEAALLAQTPLSALIERVAAERAAGLQALKLGWAERASTMQLWLDAQMAADKACPFNKSKLRPNFYQPWLAALSAWSQDAAMQEIAISDAGRARLTPAGLEDALKGDASLPPLPAEFAAFETLLAAMADLPAMAPPLRLHAASLIAQRLAALKAASGLFGFADMLTRLDQALDPAQGPSAERLRARILAQYPVALIDEFQDTSPLQTRIFDRLYRIEANARSSALLLIGDPKQAIYGFRGADIYSYLDVRAKTAGRHYVLGTNHRSTEALVEAVNQVFEFAEARAGEGAFRFRDLGTGDSPLPFVGVAARGRAERFVQAGGPVPALKWVVDESLLDAGSSQRLFAARCAEQMVHYLNDPEAGFFDAGKGEFKRLAPADMAVLVRTGREAAAVRRELRRRGVASVYLSDKDSVFASPEASDLLRCLQAVAAPLDMRLVRAALATRLLGLSLSELAALATDDEAFDARSDELRALQGIWQTQGVLAMLRQFLHRLQLPARWLNQSSVGKGGEAGAIGKTGEAGQGERRLTNFLHLAELLQAASGLQSGEAGLIRWLAAQIEQSGVAGASAAEDAVVRLESDADLVKLVTVHKSKGLEYPLVFLPFAASFRAISKARSSYVKQPDAEGHAQLYLQPSDEQIAQADVERQREDLRLLYVALTRARHALWIGVGALKVGQGKDCVTYRSAIGYVLGGAQPFEAQQLQQLARELAAGNPQMALMPAARAPELGPSLLQPRGALPPLLEAPAYNADFERRWGIGSFSALVRAMPSPALLSNAAARADEPGDQGVQSAQGVQGDPAGSTEPLTQPWHSFPRGALAGNFLHDQLEWLAGEGFHRLAHSQDLQAQLLRRCERQAWGHHAQDVLTWLLQLCSTPLPELGAALSELRRPLPEMEFWFPSNQLQSQALDALCRRHLLGGLARPTLPQRQMHGLLMGFADLVFEHQGRYFVLDYKSNHLGPTDSDYGEPALAAAMAEHRYDLQAALYLLALHRLLRARLGTSYDPTQQLGGALYFFLRGLQAPSRGCFVLRPPLQMLDELDALLQGSAAQFDAIGAAP
ncbi:exodeoxyribonuclease V subunit beta [Paucibacter sp. B2R-40]|uniref:exodeoxyribonuclease V subunit beta n=1 Tax=Paucibacter sp. B2R-40 TaxID=2893554 RepID=UPI0021E3A898|nr:exodeoxyribonuclease V subunit beta [Paucibacter sp. B2R-40]MCV2356710.1 exodeoxyribonuclease V subunit beta [Paucibacter sp. B2R-40]